jgi:hypothetical protein
MTVTCLKIKEKQAKQTNKKKPKNTLKCPV